MSPRIHPTALVAEDAEIGEGTAIGPYAIVEPGVVVGRDNVLEAHSYLYSGVRLGDRNRLHRGASLGGEPQDLKYAGEPTGCVIGHDNRFGEQVTVNRGTRAVGRTVIGDHNFLMAYAHVGHDSRLGDHIVMANSVPLGGEVEVGDHAVLGGNAAVHQFCRVGEGVMVGGLSRVTQDVLPFTLLNGDNTLVGLNRVGLRRRGHDRHAIAALKEAYRRFCLHREPLDDFRAWLAGHAEHPLLGRWHAFLAVRSRRGYARARHAEGPGGE